MLLLVTLSRKSLPALSSRLRWRRTRNVWQSICGEDHQAWTESDPRVIGDWSADWALAARRS